MSEIISLINLKGGVAKSTSVINLAYSLSLYDKKVLIVDTDSQGNISTSLGMHADELYPLNKPTTTQVSLTVV